MLVILATPSCWNRPETKITIAAASNVQFALKEIVDAFEKESGIQCEIITSSSGKLAAQILEGAPYDIFISADIKYPNTIYKRGKSSGDPVIFALGSLVLWSNNENIIPSIELLQTSSIRHIALANPMNAPYGRAAKETMEHLSIYEKLNEKFVYGENISQTTQFIKSGAAEIGFTSLSMVKASEMKNEGMWIPVESSWHKPIEQGIIALKSGSTSDTMNAKFIQFLSGNVSKQILKKFGYQIPTESKTSN